MKRYAALFLSFFLLLALTACAGANTKQDPETDPPDETVEPREPDDTVTVTTAAPTPDSAENAYDELIRRYCQIAADPYGSSAETAGERCVLTAARDMLEWDDNPLTALGYAVEDLSGDGVPELVIGFLPDYSIWQYAVYTLVDGRPQVVFEAEEGSLGYLGNGSFHYVASPPTGMGLGTVSLSIDGAQILWGDFYFTLDDFSGGAVTIYHNTTGSLDPAESELTDWTIEYFFAWEPEYEDLPMIPFSTD